MKRLTEVLIEMTCALFELAGGMMIGIAAFAVYLHATNQIGI